MEQAHHRAHPELQFETEPDVEHHQADRDAERQQTTLEQLARDLGPDHLGLGEDDLAQSAGQGGLDLGDGLFSALPLWRLEADQGGGGRAKGLHLDVAQVHVPQLPPYRGQVDGLRGGGDLQQGAAGEVDAAVQPTTGGGQGIEGEKQGADDRQD